MCKFYRQHVTREIKMLSGLVTVILKSQNYSRVWQFEKKKKTGKVKQEKKVPITSADLFLSPLPDVTVLMLLTDFLQGTALNHCLHKDNRCGRHVLDHWRELCAGDGRCGRHVLDLWGN